ncbi:MAG TPA: flagellar hook-associated protein FlgL [Myxococcales bacterium]|nr:flagellar hook-associated protein FlgL [Myxococcales bacterium]
MRISTQWLFRGAIRDMEGSLQRAAEAQEIASSGRRVRSVADDPSVAGRILRMDNQLRDADQFRRNGVLATTRLEVEDQVITTVRKLVSQARDLALTNSTRDPSDPLRAAAAVQVAQLRDQIMGLANTRVGNAYIFAGGESTSPAFQAGGTYAGNSLAIEVELDDGVKLSVNHTGDQIFSGLLDALGQLSAGLVGGSASGPLMAISDTIGTADQKLLVAQTEVGSRMLEVKNVGEDLARRSANLLDQRSTLRDADPTEAMVQLNAAQTALERAYAAVGKILSVSLVDYLR